MRELTLMVEGQLQINRDWRGVVAEKVYPLLGVFGGTAGFPSAYGEIESRWKKMWQLNRLLRWCWIVGKSGLGLSRPDLPFSLGEWKVRGHCLWLL